MIVILYFLAFLLFLIYYKKKKSVGYLLIVFYTISAFLCLLYHFFGVNDGLKVEWNAVTYYLLCIIISIIPFLIIGKYDCRSFYIAEKPLLYLSICLITFGLIDLYNSISELRDNWNWIVSDLADLRNSFYRDKLLTYKRADFFERIILYFRHMQFMSLFCCLYFYSKEKKILALLLLVASLSGPLHYITIGEREGVLVYLSNASYCFLFFDSLWDRAKKSMIRIAALTIVSPFVLFILFMTIARFGEEQGGALDSLYSYGGTQPYLFSYIFNNINIDDQALGGRMNFRYLFPASEQVVGQINNYIKSDVYLNAFAGMPGSFMFDFGYYSIIVIAFFSILYYMIIKSSNMVSGKYGMHICFLMYFSFQVLFMNIFYFDYDMNYRLFLPILFYLYCYYQTKMVRTYRHY